MANEKLDLINRNEALEVLCDCCSIEGHCSADGCAEYQKISKLTTVDAVVLPCKIGDDVYIIPSKTNFALNVLSNHKENNRVYHQNVERIVFNADGWYVSGNVDHEYGTGRILVDRFYKETWFLTREEAEAALAKRDGGNEDG